MNMSWIFKLNLINHWYADIGLFDLLIYNFLPLDNIRINESNSHDFAANEGIGTS